MCSNRRHDFLPWFQSITIIHRAVPALTDRLRNDVLRLRVGEMRVIFTMSGKTSVVLVINTVSRDDAYK